MEVTLNLFDNITALCEIFNEYIGNNERRNEVLSICEDAEQILNKCDIFVHCYFENDVFRRITFYKLDENGDKIILESRVIG